MAFLVKTGSSRLSGEKNFKWTFCFFVPKEVLHAKEKTVLSLPIFSFSRLSGRCLSVVPVWFVFSARHETMAGRFSHSRICGTGCRCVVRLPDCFVNNYCLLSGRMFSWPLAGQNPNRSRRWTNPQWLDNLDNYFCIRNFFRIPYGLDSSKKHIKTEAWLEIRPLFWYMAFLESD